MNRFSPPAASFDDKALDRALARARVPEVPSGLADRIAAAVTVLPQEATPESSQPKDRPHRPARRRYALAASFAVVAMLGGGALGLWPGVGGEPPGTRSSSVPAIVEVRPVTVESSAPVLVAAHEDSEPALRAASEQPAKERAVTAHNDHELAGHEPAGLAKPDALSEEAATSADDATVDLAVKALPSAATPQPSESEEPAGPALADSAGPFSSTPDGAVYGPPAPQTLGIAGGGSSPAPAIHSAGPAPSGAPRAPGPLKRR